MNIEADLHRLDFLSCDLETMDQFNEAYEALLNECKANQDKETARAMQRLLFKQFLFLQKEWRDEATEAGLFDQEGKAQ